MLVLLFLEICIAGLLLSIGYQSEQIRVSYLVSDPLHHYLKMLKLTLKNHQHFYKLNYLGRE